MSKGKSKTGLYALIAVIVIVVVAAAVIVLLMNPPGGQGTPLTLYAGEVSSSVYGFGNTSDSIVSPAPTLTLKQGTTYTMTVHNVGVMPHAWEITNQKATGSTVLFNARIASTSYLAPGASGSVTFTPNQTGSFFYICPVPGHVDLGMWGVVTVNP